MKSFSEFIKEELDLPSKVHEFDTKELADNWVKKQANPNRYKVKPSGRKNIHHVVMNEDINGGYRNLDSLIKLKGFRNKDELEKEYNIHKMYDEQGEFYNVTKKSLKEDIIAENKKTELFPPDISHIHRDIHLEANLLKDYNDLNNPHHVAMMSQSYNILKNLIEKAEQQKEDFQVNRKYNDPDYKNLIDKKIIKKNSNGTPILNIDNGFNVHNLSNDKALYVNHEHKIVSSPMSKNSLSNYKDSMLATPDAINDRKNDYIKYFDNKSLKEDIQSIGNRQLTNYFNKLDKVQVTSGALTGKTGIVQDDLTTHGVYRVKMDDGQTALFQSSELSPLNS